MEQWSEKRHVPIINVIKTTYTSTNIAAKQRNEPEDSFSLIRFRLYIHLDSNRVYENNNAMRHLLHYINVLKTYTCVFNCKIRPLLLMRKRLFDQQMQRHFSSTIFAYSFYLRLEFYGRFSRNHKTFWSSFFHGRWEEMNSISRNSFTKFNTFGSFNNWNDLIDQIKLKKSHWKCVRASQ